MYTHIKIVLPKTMFNQATLLKNKSLILSQSRVKSSFSFSKVPERLAGSSNEAVVSLSSPTVVKESFETAGSLMNV